MGSLGNVSQPPGLVDVDLFERIVAKADGEFRVTAVNLFNWGELMLHPRLPELIRIVRSRELKCHLSSNLNVLRDIDAVLAARPTSLRISLSGFSQEVYRQTHARGDVEKVKENMLELSRALGRVDPPLPTRRGRPLVEVFFHKYRHNLHEVEPMRKFAEELGFAFTSCWAYLMPQENAHALIDGNLPSDQQEFVDTQFALPIRRAIEVAHEYRDAPCRLLDEQVVLDLKGNLIPCCTVFELGKHSLGSYLEMDVEAQRRAKRDVPLCTKCTNRGLHTYFTYSEQPELADRYDAMARENLKRLGPL